MYIVRTYLIVPTTHNCKVAAQFISNDTLANNYTRMTNGKCAVGHFHFELNWDSF